MAYHLRVTTEHSNKSFVKSFITKFNPKLYIFSKETSGDGVQHWHAHIEYETVPKKQTLSDFFKKENLSGKYYHKSVETTVDQNKLYVCKDLDIYKHSLTEEALEELINKTEVINEDKKKDIKLKLIDAVRPQLLLFNKQEPVFNEEGKQFDVITKCTISLRDIAKIIKDVYINVYDKLPPTKSLMFQYSVYVAQKLEVCEDEVSQIYDNIF